jgi:uncharacterized protein
MKITFDPKKDEINRSKHGVSLGDAEAFEWDAALTWTDSREDYGEDRTAGIGYIGMCLYYIVFVDRCDDCRVISLRKATSTEVRRYAEA